MSKYKITDIIYIRTGMRERGGRGGREREGGREGERGRERERDTPHN